MVKKRDISMAIDLPVDLAMAEHRVRELLSSEGFGVLTEIDVQETLRTKLEVDMPGYRILGACNPALAHRAIVAAPDAGLLLPCNVVLRETPSGTRVEVADPVSMLQLIDNPVLREVAEAARERLSRVVSALAASDDTADHGPSSR
jgi:uncharacterized protein (DUF302 family)